MLSRRCVSLLLHRLNVCNQRSLSREASSLCKYQSTISVPQWNLNGQQFNTGNHKLKPTLQFARHFSSELPPKSPQDEQQNKEKKPDGELEVPLLMDFIPRGMPNFWYSIKNFYIINFLLRGQIDKSFDFKDFIEGAKQAMVTVSSCLANNQLENLNGLVDKVALEEIKTNYKRLNMLQRKELELIKTDIVLSFAHHVRIETLKEEFTGTHKHTVYLFIVFDCIRNLEEILKEKAAQRQRGNARDLFREFNNRKYVCNYEFKREYIEGGQCTDWTITKLMHIKESDLVNLVYNRYRR